MWNSQAVNITYATYTWDTRHICPTARQSQATSGRTAPTAAINSLPASTKLQSRLQRSANTRRMAPNHHARHTALAAASPCICSQGNILPNSDMPGWGFTSHRRCRPIPTVHPCPHPTTGTVPQSRTAPPAPVPTPAKYEKLSVPWGLS